MDTQQERKFLHWHISEDMIIKGEEGLILLAAFLALILLFSVIFFRIRNFFNRLPPNAAVGVGVDVAIVSGRTSSEPQTVVAAAAVLSLGLDAATINSLPVCLHGSLAKTRSIVTNNNNNNNSSDSTVIEVKSECSICLSIFEDEEMVKVLPLCHHTYHSKCVDRWLLNCSSCPICRASLLVGKSDVELVIS